MLFTSFRKDELEKIKKIYENKDKYLLNLIIFNRHYPCEISKIDSKKIMVKILEEKLHIDKTWLYYNVRLVLVLYKDSKLQTECYTGIITDIDYDNNILCLTKIKKQFILEKRKHIRYAVKHDKINSIGLINMDINKNQHKISIKDIISNMSYIATDAILDTPISPLRIENISQGGMQLKMHEFLYTDFFNLKNTNNDFLMWFGLKQKQYILLNKIKYFYIDDHNYYIIGCNFLAEATLQPAKDIVEFNKEINFINELLLV